MLGKDLIEVLKDKYCLKLTDKNELDITDYIKCEDYIINEKPELIINCAAYTLVDKCEEEKELAYKVNAIGPRNLAIIGNEHNIPILHISTDYVFDGLKGENYLENDIKSPLSIYGETKSLGEDYIVALTNRFYIVRTSWLFGENGNNFIKTMLQLAKSKDRLTVVNDQFGTPTYTKDLAKAIAKLIEKNCYGIYHITNSGYTNWCDYARYIFSLTGCKVTVDPISTEEFNRPAPRPKFSVLENRLWQLEGFPVLRSYKEAVKEYIEVNYKSEDLING